MSLDLPIVFKRDAGNLDFNVFSLKKIAIIKTVCRSKHVCGLCTVLGCLMVNSDQPAL